MKNIIVRDLMVQLGLLSEFERQVLQWEGDTLPINKPTSLLEQTYLTSLKMREVAMETPETFPTREATERLLKIVNSAYESQTFNR